MKKLFLFSLIATGFLFGTVVKAQDAKKWTVGYYSFNKDFGVSYLKNKKVYPEVRFKTKDLDCFEGTFFLRTESHLDKENKFDLSYGLGCSYDFNYNEGFLKVPFYFVKNDILAKNVNILVGFEAAKSFDYGFSIKPGIGICFDL